MTDAGPSDQERAALVALGLVNGVGHARRTTLLDACSTAYGALSAPFEFLCALPGISRACATAIKATSVAQGERVLREVELHGGTCLVPGDPIYPSILVDIPEPPGVLFALGRLELLNRLAVAVVGSRNHSTYGSDACRIVVQAATASGLCVVSGMARGLDAVAHLAALDVGGDTIGVLGNGFGVIYPSANRVLYERMRREGLLLTEFPPGNRPNAGSFQRRNRLISGLARVTVVVEAASGSGTLITVDAALSQGRDVMVVPGAITSPTSIGTNRLLRDGATPFLEPADLLALYPELQPTISGKGTPAARVDPPPALPLTLFERRVFQTLDRTPRHLDALIEVVGVPAAELLPALSALEMYGVARQEPGRRFLRA
ncbi:MAG TPA: DNA-processing protein DprA [Gemmatimonadales bacterium]|nr:DNA-processing protein DprA [Gemmatimonadales bacterium]